MISLLAYLFFGFVGFIIGIHITENTFGVISYVVMSTFIAYVLLEVFYFCRKEYLNTKYPPLLKENVDNSVTAISERINCKTFRFNDVEICIPKNCKIIREVVDRDDLLISMLPGVYMHWRIFNWGNVRMESSSELMAQVERQARIRFWKLMNKTTITIDNEVESIDVVAKARNGVTHRFINFFYIGSEYFCEFKADTPNLFVSVKPIFDACIGAFRLL